MSGERLTLAERCRIHAEKMSEEGWHTTAGVLWEAAEQLESRAALTERNSPLPR